MLWTRNGHVDDKSKSANSIHAIDGSKVIDEAIYEGLETRFLIHELAFS